MDWTIVLASAGLSALIFLCLEFTIILPLFIRVVKKATISAVNEELLPQVTTFIDQKIESLKTEISDSILARIRGMLGGTNKGVNRVMNRLAAGESLEDIEDEYADSTIDKVLSIVSAVADRLPTPQNQESNDNGSKKEDNQESGGTPSFVPLQA